MTDENIQALGGYTLIKVGNCKHSFYSSLRLIHPDPTLVPSFRFPGRLKKYVISDRDCEHPYFMIVSNARPTLDPNFSLILSVTSDSVDKNEEVVRDFTRKTRIGLRPAPERLTQMAKDISAFFVDFRSGSNPAYSRKLMDMASNAMMN